MLLTEEEAKTKWCPFVRYAAAHDDASSNRWKQSLPEDEPHALNPVPCRCIGSECMCWHWGEFIGPNGYTSKQRCDWAQTPHLGACGLAGKAVA